MLVPRPQTSLVRAFLLRTFGSSEAEGPVVIDVRLLAEVHRSVLTTHLRPHVPSGGVRP